MSSLSSPVVLLRQSFKAAAIPARREGVSEEARLRVAPVGAYEYVLHQSPQYEFRSAVFYNGAQLDPDDFDTQQQFKVSEVIEETERTLTIESLSDDISVEPVEIIPLDWKQRPLEFTRLETGARRRTIRYREDPPPHALKIRISGLNVVAVESFNACLWSDAMEEGRCCEPHAAFIERQEPIRIDLLDNPRGEARRVDEHLLKFLGIVFGQDAANATAGRDFKLECSHRYEIADGAAETSVPVLGRYYVASANVGENLSRLATMLSQWQRDASPGKGSFVFGVEVYGVTAQERVPILRLNQLLLPTESIANID
jgi:hypothetical protein